MLMNPAELSGEGNESHTHTHTHTLACMVTHTQGTCGVTAGFFTWLLCASASFCFGFCNQCSAKQQQQPAPWQHIEVWLGTDSTTLPVVLILAEAIPKGDVKNTADY